MSDRFRNVRVQPILLSQLLQYVCLDSQIELEGIEGGKDTEGGGERGVGGRASEREREREKERERVVRFPNSSNNNNNNNKYLSSAKSCS